MAHSQHSAKFVCVTLFIIIQLSYDEREASFLVLGIVFTNPGEVDKREQCCVLSNAVLVFVRVVLHTLCNLLTSLKASVVQHVPLYYKTGIGRCTGKKYGLAAAVLAAAVVAVMVVAAVVCV